MPSSSTDIDLTRPAAVKMTPSQAVKIIAFIAGMAVTIAQLWGIRDSFRDLEAELGNTNKTMIGLANQVVEIRQDMAVQQTNATLQLERATTAEFAVIRNRLDAIEERLRELAKAP